MPDEPATKDFKGLFYTASVLAALLTIGAAIGFTKDALLEEIIDRHSRDIAEQQLHLACWSQASLYPPDEQLRRYIYCRYGKVSKDVVAK